MSCYHFISVKVPIFLINMEIIVMELIERVWSHFFVLFLSHVFIIIEHDQGALDCFVAD